MTCPNQIRTNQTRPDQIRPDQTRLDQTRPDQTRPNRTWGTYHPVHDHFETTSERIRPHQIWQLKIRPHYYRQYRTRQRFEQWSDYITPNQTGQNLTRPVHTRLDQARLWTKIILSKTTFRPVQNGHEHTRFSTTKDQTQLQQIKQDQTTVARVRTSQDSWVIRCLHKHWISAN